MEEIIFLSWEPQTVKGNNVESMKKFYGKHNVGEILEIIFDCSAF